MPEFPGKLMLKVDRKFRRADFLVRSLGVE